MGFHSVTHSSPVRHGRHFYLSVAEETRLREIKAHSLQCPYCRKGGPGPGLGELCWIGRSGSFQGDLGKELAREGGLPWSLLVVPLPHSCHTAQAQLTPASLCESCST